MGDTTERLILETTTPGAEKLDDLAAKQDKVTDSQGRMRDAQGRFVVAGDRAAAATKKVGDAAGDAADKVDRVEPATKKAGKGAANLGQSMMELGRIVQDVVQGGIGGGLNNIERMTMSLGGNAGLAGALTIVGVGFALAAPHIKEFVGSLGLAEEKAQGFADAAKALEKVVKELLEKQGVSIVDLANLDAAQAKLDQLKASQAAFNALKGASTNLQEKVAKRVKDVVIEESGGTDEESGAANLARLLEAAQRRAGTFGKIGANVGLDQEKDALARRLAEDRAEFEGGASSPERAEALLKRMDATEARLKTIAAQILGNARKANEGLIGDASRGIERARRQIADLFDAQADVFNTGAGVANPVGPGFRGKLELAGPEQIRAGQAFDAATRANVAADQARRDRANREIDALNRQGAEAEAAGRIAADAQKARDDARARADAPIRPKALAPAGPMALGTDRAPKGKVDGERERAEAAIRRRAGQIEDRSRALTGVRFTAEQAREIAAESIKLQARGLDANQATMTAMNGAIQLMVSMSNRVERQIAAARQMGGVVDQLAHQLGSNQSSAQNGMGPGW